MRLRFVTILFLAIAGLSLVRAQHAMFLSKTLTDIAKGINYHPNDTLPAGDYEIGTYLGQPAYAEYNDKHVVTNLGLRLFSPELKKVYASDVYAFLERYFLELYTWKGKNSVKQKMHDDKVYITCGSITDIKRITYTTPVSISRTEDKYYKVTWTDNGQDILAIAFPIQYELLLGMPQVEIEQKMHDYIVNAPCTPDSIPETDMELVKDSVYKTKSLAYYDLEALNTSVYYTKSKSGAYSLLMDTVYNDLSAMNLFHAISKCNNPLKMDQGVYGFKHLDYTVSLHQWLEYCFSEGLRIYTGIEEEYEDGYKLLVICENKDMGYNHLLSVIVPKEFLRRPNKVLTVKLTAFIPTHNIRNLYQQYTVQKKKQF